MNKGICKRESWSHEKDICSPKFRQHQDNMTHPWNKTFIAYMAPKFMLTSLQWDNVKWPQLRSFLVNQHAKNKAQWKSVYGAIDNHASTTPHDITFVNQIMQHASCRGPTQTVNTQQQAQNSTESRKMRLPSSPPLRRESVIWNLMPVPAHVIVFKFKALIEPPCKLINWLHP